jgi:hypothetical protein
VGERRQTMNRMGWTIALAGAWALAAVALTGLTDRAPTVTPDCMPGFYLSGGWCVLEPQPTEAPDPGADQVLVALRTASFRHGREATSAPIS